MISRSLWPSPLHHHVLELLPWQLPIPILVIPLKHCRYLRSEVNSEVTTHLSSLSYLLPGQFPGVLQQLIRADKAIMVPRDIIIIGTPVMLKCCPSLHSIQMLPLHYNFVHLSQISKFCPLPILSRLYPPVHNIKMLATCPSYQNSAHLLIIAKFSTSVLLIKIMSTSPWY